MQLGTRWSVGDEPPARLPEPVRAAVRTVEAELRAADQPTAEWRWTLTYLEGSPVVDLDDGTRIRMTGPDSAVVSAADAPEPDED